jgi:Tfp pilus assembly protein PilF
MEPQKNDVTAPVGAHVPLRKRVRRRLAQLASAANPRDRLWDFLNAFEENRRFRTLFLGTLVLFGVLVVCAVVFGPRWRENSAIAVARQWLVAGKLDRAEEAISVALTRAPHRVEAWQVAADHARSAGMRKKAVTFRRQAVLLRPSDTALILDWAGEAVAAENFSEAEIALGKLPADFRVGSAWAQRLVGEMAKRRGDLVTALRQFETAVRLGGPLAENEIPLGIILVGSGNAEDQRAGRELLNRWRNDSAWGLEALRALLANALAQGDVARLPELAEALMAHPAHERADTLNGLLALEKSAPAQFTRVLNEVQRSRSADPAQVAELVGWLSGIGHAADAVSWLGNLPPEIVRVPPVAPALADALRVTNRWADLRIAVLDAEWGEIDFLRRAYLMIAERGRGEGTRADELWSGLKETSRLNGGRALFLAGTLYSWGDQAKAVELWWMSAEQAGVGVSALASLARHYQLKRDAEGLHRTFRRLHELKSADARVANNYAFFAALTGHNLPGVERITLANHEEYPDEPVYAATRAFVLHITGKTAAAVALLPRFAAAAEQSPALAFTSGLVLVGAGRNAEARKHLANVDERSLTLRELELLNQARSASATP